MLTINSTLDTTSLALNNKEASIIADAILFDHQAMQLVARFNGNKLEMDKSWELMSELM